MKMRESGGILISYEIRGSLSKTKEAKRLSGRVEDWGLGVEELQSTLTFQIWNPGGRGRECGSETKGWVSSALANCLGSDLRETNEGRAWNLSQVLAHTQLARTLQLPYLIRVLAWESAI